MHSINYIKSAQHPGYFEWMQKGIACWKKCEELISESTKSGKYMGLISVCRDVTEMCNQCLRLETKYPPFFNQVCELSSQACEACLKELSKYQNDSNLVVEVMYACRLFSIACLEMEQKPENRANHNGVIKK